MNFLECKRKITDFLSTYQRRKLDNDIFRPAGVLIPFVNINKDAHLILTLRSGHVATHKNQVAFPGGAMESEDTSIISTSLRETEEEIGVVPADVSIWGKFDDFYTISYYKITPVIGEFRYPYPFKKQEEEIAEIFTVPLEIFLTERFFREKMWEKNGKKYPVYYYYFNGFEIWGITAYIINSFIEKVFSFNPARSKIEPYLKWRDIFKS